LTSVKAYDWGIYAMPKIKIVSNPYKNKIAYKKWDEQENNWAPINIHSDANSELLCAEFTDSFFPFKIKKIVDIIIRDYKLSSSKLEIMFEGTEDEFDELKAVCSSDYYQEKVVISRSSVQLKNARDILPEVKSIFKLMKPIITETARDTDKILKERKKFDDVSKEVIPLCVIGNYSSGKSTFINALIGYEILPSGDESLTAKIHEIKPSSSQNVATLNFLYNGSKAALHFEDDGYNIFTFTRESPLFVKLNEAMNEENEWTPVRRLARCLEIINYYDKDTHDEKLDDLIQITTPFNPKGLFGEKSERYIIFDTPGSNSATNDNHILVLKKAMENLSNGIPIYISEYNTLDSVDNEKLCNEIKEMQQLDNRFTMIVVNKADIANLDKKTFSENTVLNQAIPKNLYSEGLYFVSSILGLGFKTDGVFENRHYGKTFRSAAEDYTDPDSPYYTRLYDFNILPEQIKSRAVSESEQSENLIYTNSGLYWIEKEIDTFAEKYSSYNKCWQSLLFLRRVVDISFDIIEEKKKKLELSKDQRQKQLNTEKAAFVEKIEKRNEELSNTYLENYKGEMNLLKSEVCKNYTINELQNIENAVTEEVKAETGYNDQVTEKKEAWGSTIGKLKTAVSSEGIKHLGSAVKDFSQMAKSFASKSSEVKSAMDNVERIAADRIMSMMTESYRKSNEDAVDIITDKSAVFWSARCQDIRQEMLNIVLKAEEITEEKKSEIKGIITEYAEPDLGNLKEIVFDKSDFQSFVIELGNLHLFADNRINKLKLSKFYNTELSLSVDMIIDSIQEAHVLSFNLWKYDLLQTILGRITDLNSELKGLCDLIRNDTNEIEFLSSRKEMLEKYANDIEKLMDWNEAQDNQ
jgi:GTPase SAR1 family protein